MPVAHRSCQRTRSKHGGTGIGYREVMGHRFVVVCIEMMTLACKQPASAIEPAHARPATTPDASATSSTPASDAPVAAGVPPDRFDCATIATTAELARIFGSEARETATPYNIPRGLAKPCTYVTSAARPETWTFDFDCRDNYQATADALFAQYRQLAPATDVKLGAKAMDYGDRGFMFVDDDAPCYVRIVGNAAAKRLELATLIAKRLTLATAPIPRRSLAPDE